MAIERERAAPEILVGYRVQGAGPGTTIKPKKVEQRLARFWSTTCQPTTRT